MATTSSNIYAEKIYAEHPVAMWLLDDTADYHNLISESLRDVPNNLDTDPETYVGWNVYGGTAENGEADDTAPPFTASYVVKIVGDVPTVSEETITLLSPDIINANELNQDISNFNVSTYFYSDIKDTAVKYISIGIEYLEETELETKVVSVERKYSNIVSKQWIFLSATFDIPATIKPIRMFISATVDDTGTTNEYNFYVNGMSFGQLSEEFSATSLGAEPQAIPSDINLEQSLQVVPAYAYGISEDTGYYILNGSILSAVNTSIPLVYGASNITSVKTNEFDGDSVPSLILPGKGFLNKVGQYGEYTVEFWARINSDASIPRKIFGPIASKDGLYVEDGFLTLVIGSKSSSHFVGEWYRPMLIQIRLIRNAASLIINGEEVVSINFLTDSITLPDEFTDGKSNDWLGFYGYDDVYPFEIDCVSVYTYQVPTIVAKRRYAYGQAVGSAENINAAFGGNMAFIDYSFANYTANYNYPDFAKWEQGTFDNLTTSQNYLSTPEYTLPVIFTSTKELKKLYGDNKAIQNEDIPFITFRPNEGWDNLPTYINFDKFNAINSEVYGFCGVFKPVTDSENNEILFKIYDKSNGNYFSIEKDVKGVQNTIDYYLMYNGQRTEFLSKPYTLGERISIGVDVGKMSEYYGGNLATFFSNQSALSMYVGGDEEGTHSFTGNIYQIGLSTKKNAIPMRGYCNENGTFPLDLVDEVLAHLSSYTLYVENSHGIYQLDVGVSGSWQDYMPLSYFAKYVTDADGNKVYDVDFLQLNIGYPAISSLIEKITEGQEWSYQELFNEYANATPVLTYKDLIGTWSSYELMQTRSETTYSYDTSNTFLKSYISFQYIADGANTSGSLLPTTKPAEQSRIIDVSDSQYDLTWNTTRFEVVDNTVIYPRKDIDINDVAIVYDIEINIKGITGKKIGIGNFQLASQSLNNNNSNKIGTRFGIDMYPYKKAGLYNDYKGKNPFSIYKGSTPYLYLTRTSGIQIRGNTGEKNTRGLYIPINEKLAQKYSVNAAQLWMRYDDDYFPENPEPLFEISYKTENSTVDTIRFFIQSLGGTNKRAKIFALHNDNKSAYSDILYYINGKYSPYAIVSSKIWTSLGISFLNPLDYTAFSGKLSLVGNMVFNNVSYYKTNDIANIQSIIPRSWNKVLVEANPNYPIPAENNGVDDGEGWQYWLNFDSGTWFDVYAQGSFQIAGFNPSTIYNAYIGTNKIVIDDSAGLLVNSDGIKSYSAISYNRNTYIPV